MEQWTGSKLGKEYNKVIYCNLVYLTSVMTNLDSILKGRGTRDQIANIHWVIEKAREFQKNVYFCFIDYSKAFDCVDHNKLEDSERVGNTRPHDLFPEKSVCRSRSNS